MRAPHPNAAMMAIFAKQAALLAKLKAAKDNTEHDAILKELRMILAQHRAMFAAPAMAALKARLLMAHRNALLLAIRLAKDPQRKASLQAELRNVVKEMSHPAVKPHALRIVRGGARGGHGKAGRPGVVGWDLAAFDARYDFGYDKDGNMMYAEDGEFIGFDFGGFLGGIIHQIHKVASAIGPTIANVVSVIPPIGGMVAVGIRGGIAVLDAVDKGDDKAKAQVAATVAAANAGDPNAKAALMQLQIAQTARTAPTSPTPAQAATGLAVSLLPPYLAPAGQAVATAVHGAELEITQEHIDALNHLRALAHLPPVSMDDKVSSDTWHLQDYEDHWAMGSSNLQDYLDRWCMNGDDIMGKHHKKKKHKKKSHKKKDKKNKDGDPSDGDDDDGDGGDDNSGDDDGGGDDGGGDDDQGGGDDSDADMSGSDEHDEENVGKGHKKKKAGGKKSGKKKKLKANPNDPSVKHMHAMAIHLVQQMRKAGKHKAQLWTNYRWIQKHSDDPQAKSVINALQEANKHLKKNQRVLLGLESADEIMGGFFLFDAIGRIFNDIIHDPLKYLLPVVGPIIRDIAEGKPVDFVDCLFPGVKATFGLPPQAGSGEAKAQGVDDDGSGDDGGGDDSAPPDAGATPDKKHDGGGGDDDGGGDYNDGGGDDDDDGGQRNFNRYMSENEGDDDDNNDDDDSGDDDDDDE